MPAARSPCDITAGCFTWAWASKPEAVCRDVTILVADNDATVIETANGQILGEYVLNATKDYQGKKKKPPVDTEDLS